MINLRKILLNLMLLTFLPSAQFLAQANEVSEVTGETKMPSKLVNISETSDASKLLVLSPEEHAERQVQETSLTPLGYQLNAMNPSVLANFYSHLLGMHLVESDEAADYYALGNAAGEILLEIFPATAQRTSQTSGLYHGAFLFDSEVEFGTTLAHLLENKAPMHGYSDHGFSKAAYLGDIEGNSIELYLDTPTSSWQVDEFGYKKGGNDALDITPFLLQRSEDFTGFGPGVTLGHFHLSVQTIADTEWFYGEVLGLGQSSAPTSDTAFFATGDYHHYLGSNTWLGENLSTPTEGLQGLRATIWQAGSADDIAYILSQLDAAEISYEESDQELIMLDNSGLKVIIRK